MSVETRSRVMRRIKGKNTGPERTLFRELSQRRAAFSRHVGSLPGCPDMVFHRARLAVFIDGDFWHGWRFPLWAHKLSAKWRHKISETRERDQRNFRRLRSRGWIVLRLWEHQVDQDAQGCVARVIAARDGSLKR